MQSYTYAISHNLSQPITEQTYILAAATLIFGMLISWLICSSSKKSAVARLSAEIEAERNRVNEAKHRLASTQQDLQILRDAEATLKQNQAILVAKFTAEQAAAKEKELTFQDLQDKLSDSFKTISNDTQKANQEHLARLQQTAIGDLDKRNSAVEQLLSPVALTLQNVEQRLNTFGELQKSREGAYTSLSAQVANMADSQQAFQKETSELVIALHQLHQERFILLPSEVRQPIDPLDALTGDDDSHDFSRDSFADEFEGFTAETPGDGI